LHLCHSQPNVHNNLANIFRQQGQYTKAIYHYKQALNVRPKFYEAWFGIGLVYDIQKRLSLSLEAYSHICKINEKAKSRVIKLLKNKRYAVVAKDIVLDMDGLLALYQPERLDAINMRLADCGLHKQAEPLFIFLNFYFDSRIVSFISTELINQQFNTITAALQHINPKQIVKVHGHTDSRPFKNLSFVESKQRNLKLSEERATIIADALRQYDIKQSIQVNGHGYNKPLVRGKSLVAYTKNRRIEIEVEPIKQKPIDDY
ncbi:MAG: tetratricopeptide repeat protein, partial [Proteobacteria bacterium]|nr:tetratricopeptide repeat protein [Pseudomonadota bacterium]